MRHGRVDDVQPEIVRALRKAGASVVSLADMGKGVPDLLVGYRGATYLMEVKTGNGKLRASQEKFIAEWRGRKVDVVRSIRAALAVIGIIMEGEN